MTKEFEQLNAKYNDETVYPVFPFISKHRITLLPAGFYRKHRANYRGVTAVYNKETKQYEFPLFGMYHIEEDLVIVPSEMELTDSKKAFLDNALKTGFKQIDGPPSYKTYKFSPDSVEAQLARENKIEHQCNTDLDFDIGSD